MPPQCDGIPLKGWDWEGVDGEESAVKTTWGSYEVTGRFEGERFVVLEAGPPPSPPEDDKDHFKSPCAVSDDDWERPDPEMATDRDQVRAINAAEKEPDFAAAWIDYIDPPTEFMDPGNVILNAAFTGDLQTHEEDLREFWGGPLCVSQLERPYKELIRIQKELNGEIPPSNFLGSSVDVVLNRVELQVARMTEDELEEIEERYGEGTVAIEVRLQPVD